MSKILTLKIDVTKLDKTAFFKGQKGTYVDITVFLKDEKDQYGHSGMVKQDLGKERKGEETPILGNVTRVYDQGGQQRQQPVAPQMDRQARQADRAYSAPAPMNDEESIPF